MNRGIKLLAVTSLCLLSSSITFADKPEWAGNGGKPSKYEKREHVNEMTSKHEYKKHKKEKYKRDEYREHDHDREEHERDEYREHDHDRYENDSRYSKNGEYYEGKGMSDSEFIDQKKDETKKNWIGKFFDFLN